MAERLTNHETNSQQSGTNLWETTMAEVPEFQDQTGEPTSKELSPDMVHHLEQLQSELESLGAKPEIMQNPAFQRILEKGIGRFNNGMESICDANIYAEMRDDTARIMMEGTIGRRQDSEKGCAEGDIYVDQNGDISIMYGDTQVRKTGEGYRHDELNTHIRQTKLKYHEKQDLLQVDEIMYKQTLQRLNPLAKPNPGEKVFRRYEFGATKSVDYDQDGRQTYMHYTEGVLASVEKDNISSIEEDLTSHIYHTDSKGRPREIDYNSFNYYKHQLSHRTLPKCETNYRISRNADDTAEINGIYRGHEIHDERALIQSEHNDGTLDGALKESLYQIAQGKNPVKP